MRKHFHKPSPAMVIALVALAVVLSPTAYAATAKLITGADVKDSSLTGADIKSSSLTGADVRDSSLTGADVKSSSLTGRDIKDGTVGAKDLDPAAVKALVSAQQPTPVQPVANPAPSTPALTGPYTVAAGLVARTGTATIGPGQTGKADATCEPGFGVTSGGFRTTGEGRVTSSEYTGPNTWSVSYDNTDATGDATVTAIVHCSLENVPPLPLP